MNAEVPPITWLQGSLTHWILWNLPDFSHSEAQSSVMFSCYLANEDRLFIPTRKVFNYIQSLFLRNENEIGGFISSVYPPNQEFS